MEKIKKRIAIIPARGGSKRILNKNIRNFCGEPMITYILKTAFESDLFDVIHVSTDSNLTKEVVERNGFKVEFMRPADLADDLSPIMPVLKFVIEEYHLRGSIFEETWLLMACSPLITSIDLQKAAVYFELNGAQRPVLAISEYPVPIEWAFIRQSDGILTPVNTGIFQVRSQDLNKKYFDAGIFAIYPSELVRNSKGAGTDCGYLGYVLQKGTTIDIDDESDWELAEAMYRSRKA